MADIYSKIEAYNAVGGNDAGATVGANARKTDQVYNTGTRQLVFLQLEVTCVTDNLDTNYASANSNFSKLMSILQQRIEVYGVGEPSTNAVTVITTKDSLAMTAAEEADPGDDVDVIMNMIEAESAIFSNATVYWGSKINGWNLENDC
jgi:hypothetical protein